MRPPEGKRSQRGGSLVSLMIGLLLSMICALVMMALYKVTVRTVFGNQGMVRNARQDAALASGLLSAQISMQEAGFGIPSAAVGRELVALKTASFDPGKGALGGTVVSIGKVEAAAEVLMWESNATQSADASKWDCRALWSGAAADGQPVLYLLEAAKPCHPAAEGFAKLKWSYSTLVPAQLLSAPVGLGVQTVDACWPFGAVPSSVSGLAPQTGLLQVRLVSRNSSSGTAAEPADRSFIVCLPNFKS